MKLIRKISIRARIILLVLTISIVSSVITSIIYYNFEIKEYKKQLVNYNISNAKLIGEYATVPLIFEDTNQTKDVLKKLEKEKSIINAIIFDHHSNIVAKLNNKYVSYNPLMRRNKTDFFFNEDYLHIENTILHEGKTIGRVYIVVETELSQIRTDRFRFALIILLITIIITTSLAYFQYKFITRLINELINFTAKVSENKDYSIRIPKVTKDEIGILYDEFNNLLNTIQIHEERIKQEKEIAENYLDIVEVLLVACDSEGRITLLNRKGYEILEYKYGELLGKNWFRTILPQSEEAYEATYKGFREIINGNIAPWEYYENPVLTKSGEKRLIAWHNKLIKDKDGKIIGTLSAGEDITERREAELQIVKEKEKAENYLNIVEVILVAFDKSAKITLLNRKGHEVLGYQEGELYDKNWFEICLKKEEKDEVFEIYQKIVAGEIEPFEYNENYIITRNGEERLIAWHNKLINNEEGEIIGILSSGEDITMQRQSELALQELNSQLEAKIKERTIELENANKELEAFSYSVSHDLRAPLRHINGYIELLSNHFPDALPEKGKHYLEVIFESANEMGKLIDDLLQFSRNSRQEIKKMKYDLNTQITEVLTAMKPDIKKRNIEWILNTLPEINADYDLLKMVWVNLISNAIKYTQKKEKAIIEIGYTKDNKHYEFYVKDNGAGFNMQYAQKLFGVFQRMHSNAEFEGTGIGLANVKRIITRHGGNVWAEAEVDKGACFYFSLPIK